MTSDRWHSTGTPVSFSNKTDRHDIAEILLKVALNTLTMLSVVSLNDHLLFIQKQIGMNYNTIFNNTLFKAELFVQLVFGNPDTNQNPVNVNVIV